MDNKTLTCSGPADHPDKPCPYPAEYKVRYQKVHPTTGKVVPNHELTLFQCRYHIPKNMLPEGDR